MMRYGNSLPPSPSQHIEKKFTVCLVSPLVLPISFADLTLFSLRSSDLISLQSC